MRSIGTAFEFYEQLAAAAVTYLKCGENEHNRRIELIASASAAIVQ